MRYEFTNNNNYPIILKGPDGKKFNFDKGQTLILDSWFKRYSPRYIKIGKAIDHNKIENKIENNVNKVKNEDSPNVSKNINSKSVINKSKNPKYNKYEKRNKKREELLEKRKIIENRRDRRKSININERNRRLVGTRNRSNATKHLKKLLQLADFKISDNIGIGILSYNRLNSLKRLMESIRKFTNLNKVNVFISDESTNKEVKDWIKSQSDITGIINKERIGISGQTNRLMRCLDRFKYKFILNDDVEILRHGWLNMYINASKKAGYHHLCFRMPGIYGANDDEKEHVENGITICTVKDKPHGAFIYFDDVAFKKVGYFDERFSGYGMEHVDWSNRISLSGIQQEGYHDICGSEQFIKIHDEKSALEKTDKLVKLSKNRKLFNQIKGDESRIYVHPTPKSKVPEVTYIVPFQVNDRNDSIKTVIECIRSQNFPRIEIIIVEQDIKIKFKYNDLLPVNYYLARPNNKGDDFNKSLAFNTGVNKSNTNVIILHDADMIMQSDYTSNIYDNINQYDSCHISKFVDYLDKKSTEFLNNKKIFDISKLKCSHTVNYFEGGSLAVKKNKYIEIGGFDEKYVGYGCEDCEFYERLNKLTKFNESRKMTLVHLYHGRTDGWQERHEKNKKYYNKIVKSKTLRQRSSDLKKILLNKYGELK